MDLLPAAYMYFKIVKKHRTELKSKLKWLFVSNIFQASYLMLNLILKISSAVK